MPSAALLLSTFVFALALIPDQQEPEDVQARMQRYNQALGVQCTHCHVEGRWKDETLPPFAVAQNMSSMVAAVNQRIGGAPKVSCWTCHRGGRRPPRQPPALLDAELAKWPASLVDAPETRKITMAVYNVALGVGCDHCHGSDWTSTDKPAMQMVKTMNGLFEIFPLFMPAGVRTQCYMCHQGSTRPALAQLRAERLP